MTTSKKQFQFATVPVFLSFLCMGFGDAVGPFVGLARDEFALSNFTAGFITFFGFIMFGILSIPMGIFQDRKGKKFVLMLGLIIALLGLIIPVFGSLNSFEVFIVTIFLLGTGAATLQVAGNPIMRDVSPEGKYSRNLSLGQFVKAIGSLSGAVIPPLAVSYFGLDWKILFPIYSSFILLTIVLLSFSRVNEKRHEEAPHASFKSCMELLFKNPYVLLMVSGIFLYVGAEVSVSQGIPLFLEEQFGINIAEKGLLGTGLFFTALVIGRFSGGLILNWLKPKTFLVITALISILGILGIFTGNETLSVGGVFITGLGFANVFPLIFSITIDRLPERSNELSGLMVTAIVGGALVPLLMNGLSEVTSVLFSFIVPLACIGYILYVGFRNVRIK